ncbi:MAG: nickel-responsive transcriptional regulator NikR [Candidatus Sumerlaeia bacterium]
MSELERFTISMDGRLLERFDTRNARKGYSNRSESIRDLVRKCLVEEEWEAASEGSKVAATVTLVFDHHKRELSSQLTETQHRHSDAVVASTHVHLDNDNCLEVVILRGRLAELRHLADHLLAMKGVKHGQAVFTTEGKGLF